MKKRKGTSIEHFGYADGISQPIFLRNDSAWPKKAKDRNPWNPAAPLKLVLVRDEFAKDKDCFGSYLVFFADFTVDGVFPVVGIFWLRL